MCVKCEIDRFAECNDNCVRVVLKYSIFGNVLKEMSTSNATELSVFIPFYSLLSLKIQNRQNR